MNTTAETLEKAFAEIPVLDIHTHLCGPKLTARGLHDVILYHMIVSDLYAAGCPSGARLTQYPGWATKEEAHARIQEALPYLKYIQNTSGWWTTRIILRDLYDWEQPVTADNWRKLDDVIRERADDKAWQRCILERSNIRRACAEYARRENGDGDDVLQYSLEWGMFMRCQWGEYDTAVYDLERTWGHEPEMPVAIGGGARPKNPRTIRTVEDVHAAIDWYVNAIPYDQIVSTAAGISTEIDYTLPTDDEMAAALNRRDHASTAERNIYAAYIGEAFLAALEKKNSGILYQFSIGAEPLPFETASRLSQRTLGQVADIVARHPKLNFQAFVASKHGHQTFCTMCRELPNISLAGYWWHSFFPESIRQIMGERLDMVPVNKQAGFFSDAYVVEWAYGKMKLIKRLMAQVYGQRVDQGQFTKDEAVAIAKAVLWDSPQTLCGMTPEPGRLKAA